MDHRNSFPPWRRARWVRSSRSSRCRHRHGAGAASRRARRCAGGDARAGPRPAAATPAARRAAAAGTSAAAASSGDRSSARPRHRDRQRRGAHAVRRQRAEADRAAADEGENVTPPPPDVLEKQLLERLITERVLMQFAKETGIRVDDAKVERTIQRIAAGEQALARGVPQAARARRHPLRQVPRGHPQRDHDAAAARARGREPRQRHRCRSRPFARHGQRAGRRRGRVPAGAHAGARAGTGHAGPDRRASAAAPRTRCSRSRPAPISARSPRAFPTRRTRFRAATSAGAPPARLPTVFADPVRRHEAGRGLRAAALLGGFPHRQAARDAQPQPADGRRADAVPATSWSR